MVRSMETVTPFVAYYIPPCLRSKGDPCPFIIIIYSHHRTMTDSHACSSSLPPPSPFLFRVGPPSTCFFVLLLHPRMRLYAVQCGINKKQVSSSSCRLFFFFPLFYPSSVLLPSPHFFSLYAPDGQVHWIQNK